MYRLAKKNTASRVLSGFSMQFLGDVRFLFSPKGLRIFSQHYEKFLEIQGYVPKTPRFKLEKEKQYVC